MNDDNVRCLGLFGQTTGRFDGSVIRREAVLNLKVATICVGLTGIYCRDLVNTTVRLLECLLPTVVSYPLILLL